MPIIATASTICAQLYPRPRRGRCPAMPARRRSTPLRARFAYAFEGKGGYPAVVDGRSPARLISTIGRHLGRASSTSRTAPSPAPACASTRAAPRSVIRPISMTLTDDMATLFEGSTCGSSMRCAAGRIRPIRISRRRSNGFATLGAEARYPDPYGQQHGLSHLAAPSCPPGSSRAMTGMEIDLVNDGDQALHFIYLVGCPHPRRQRLAGAPASRSARASRCSSPGC